MPVYKDKNGTWYLKYKNRTKRGFKTKRAGQEYEVKLKLESTSGSSYASIYFKTVALDFLNWQYQRYRDDIISYGTYAKIKNAIHVIILPNTENKKLISINEMDCRKFHESLSTMNYSSVHKNYILNVYKGIFKHATRYFGFEQNPAKFLESYKKSFNEKMKKKEKENNIWTMDEFNKFICMVDKPVYKTLFTVLFLTGARISETLALQWKNYNGTTISITKAITRKSETGHYKVKETKNVSSIREIELGHNLSTLLDDFKQREMKVAGFNEDWYIFGRLEPLPQTSIDRIKDTAIKKAGVKRIRIHDFRHSHASNLIANGINIVAVSKRLGHSDINMTLHVYTHLLRENELDLVRFLDKSSQNLLTK